MMTPGLTDRQIAVYMQFQLHLAHAARIATRIQSGVYKKRIVKVGGYYSDILMTEEELLQDEINTQQQHMNHALECMDHFHKNDEEKRNAVVR